MSCNPTSSRRGRPLSPRDFPMKVGNARILLTEVVQIAGNLSSCVARLMHAPQHHFPAEQLIEIDRLYGRLIELRPKCVAQQAALAVEKDPDAPCSLDPLVEAFLGQSDELLETLARLLPVSRERL